MTSNTPKEKTYLIPILSKSMELLELLAVNPQGLLLQEMIDLLGYPKTTLFRIARSFVEMNYLYKDDTTGRFFLSRHLFKLGLASLGSANLVERSLNPMRDLRDEIKESVMLGTVMDNRVALLEQVLGSHDFIFMNKPGGKFCMHASATGKVLIAYLDNEKQTEIINSLEFTRFNDRTITTKKGFKAEIKSVLECGFGVDKEEEVDGIHCIAAPVFNQFNKVVAAVWTSGPSGRLKLSDFPSVSQKVIECADKISHNLGYCK